MTCEDAIRETEQLRAELAQMRGAMNAQDGRERAAGEACGVSWLEHGCDWSDAVAEAVCSLRAELERKEEALDAWQAKLRHADQQTHLAVLRAEKAEARVAELTEALRPFAQEAAALADEADDCDSVYTCGFEEYEGQPEAFTVGDLRRAALALEVKP